MSEEVKDETLAAVLLVVHRAVDGLPEAIAAHVLMASALHYVRASDARGLLAACLAARTLHNMAWPPEQPSPRHP